MGDYKYKAFISYSHKDRKWTRWLHRRLETYPIPKNIIGNVTSAGPIPKRLKPIFRDREELSASNNLGEKIEAALASSQSLIIICSPAAAKSKWVNQEILTFKRNNRDAQLFSVIVEGEPYASGMPGREDEECFPPALRFEVNSDGSLSDVPAEPLAADLRPHADGKRLGFLKLISGMVGVGLDEVVQRDMKRSRKRVTAITSGSLATVLAMGMLTGLALDARLEAELAQAEAEAGRNDAEESIEFMLTDLKPELEKVGRLETLKVVGKRAEKYYYKYPISKHGDEALGRRARVFHFLGSILDKEGDLATANEYFLQAYEATDELLSRDPKNADRIFEHAQSAYYAGSIPFFERKYNTARPYFDEYIKLAEKLNIVEPESLRGLQEKTYAYTNLGAFLAQTGNKHHALQIYETSIPIYKKIASSNLDNPNYVIDLAQAYAWMADASEPDYKLSLLHRKEQVECLREALEYHKENLNLVHHYLLARAGEARAEIAIKNYDVAKTIIEMELQKSIMLSLRNEDNLHWIENQALFYLLDAENDRASGRLQEAVTSLENYVAIKNKLQNKQNYTSYFFDRQTIRFDQVSNGIFDNQLYVNLTNQ